MKLSIAWLREWVEVDATPERIADALTRRGFYVEGVEAHGRSYPGVVVAKVLEVQKHPNADKLSLARVDAGAGELRIVCGATNLYVGMIAPLATVGAKLPGGVTIKKSKIRGEESQGMLCSADELALGDDHSGIVDLKVLLGKANGLAMGQALDELMPPPDAILEVEIPFNRPDGLGLVGLAREVKAAFGGRWTAAARERLAARWSGAAEFDVTLEDPEGCPRYIAQAIEHVTIGPSPSWLQRRLETLGQRPINNVVDLTNLVLFELGQPVHAFDLDRLRGPAIVVRRARAKEWLITLDGKPRELGPEVLVIADREAPVALAGIMGGAESEVGESTTRLLLECAWFEPRRVRRGSRFLGLSTEASKRYERGVDPEVAPIAAARFLALLQEIVPGATLGRARDARVNPPSPRRLTVRRPRWERLIGLAIPADEATRQLEAMEFGVVAGGDALDVTVPSWRPDVTIEDDLVEEIARGHGYDRIPEAPLETHGVYAHRTARERTLERARRAMLARGFSEAWCTSLVTREEAERCAVLLGEDPRRLIALDNPMSRESEVLRPNLVPGLLRAVAHNQRQGRAAVRLFEIGAGILGSERPLPDEPHMIAAVVCGPRYAHAHDASQQPVDFDEAKGLWEAWLDEMRVDTPEWHPYSGDGWKLNASAKVASGTSRIGWAGTLARAWLRAWEIEGDVHLFVALLDPLIERDERRAGVVLPGRFPPVSRDFAFFVPHAVTHDALVRTVRNAAGPRLASIEVFDVYTGPGTPDGMKSLAFALQFQDPDQTLEDKDVQAIQDRIVAAVADQCGGRLREK